MTSRSDERYPSLFGVNRRPGLGPVQKKRGVLANRPKGPQSADRVYQAGGVGAPPLTGVQTITIAPGGAVIADLKIERGGRFVPVDHALSRTERSRAGFLIVDGPPNDEIMHSGGVSKQGCPSVIAAA